jgi:hypothetical protein
MWERAEGVTNDACRDPKAARPAATIRGVAVGSTVEKVLRAVGQPHTRLGDEFTYCAAGLDGATAHVTVHFSPEGKVVSTSSTTGP